jgi:hypothetical protein
VVGAQALATTLLANHGLTLLDLCCNQIGLVATQALVDVIDKRHKVSDQQFNPNLNVNKVSFRNCQGRGVFFLIF